MDHADNTSTKGALTAWWHGLNPYTREVVIDLGIALGLMLFSWAQVSLTETLFITRTWYGQLVQGVIRPVVTGGFLALLAGCFLPLALRRQVPWAVLAAVSLFCLVTHATQGASIAIAGPMVALFTAAERTSRRQAVWATAIMLAVFILVPLVSDPNVTLLRLIEDSALLLASSAMGVAVRTRKELLDEARRRADEAEAARREAELARAEAERTREEMAARRVEEERVSIAREVHDITAHSLTAVTIQAAAAERLVDTNPEQAKEAIATVRSIYKDALKEVRGLIAVLQEPGSAAERTPTNGTENLSEVIDYLRRSGSTVDLDTSGYDRTAVPGFVDVALYRIVREASTNVVRHAPGSAVRMRLACENGQAVAEVVNGASSNSPAEAASLGGGHGIEGMRERAQVLGGSLTAGPEAGGFAVRARIPLVQGARRSLDEEDR